MILNKLVVDNFQGHVHSELEFSPHVNIITGDTDSGKTSLFRALVKAVRDTPHGAEFISTWSDDCTISVELDDGTIVNRVVSGKKDSEGKTQVDKHSYQITQEGHTEAYTGFGMTVPQDVIEAFKMPLIPVGKDEIDLNFSDQHKPYFLVKKEHGLARVKLFSKLSHADVLEDTRGEIKTLERSLKSTINTQKELLTRTNKDIEEFSTFKAAKPFLVEAKSLIVAIEKKKKVMEIAKSIIDIQVQIKTLQLQIGELSCILTQQEILLSRTIIVMEQQLNLSSTYHMYQKLKAQEKMFPDMGLVGNTLTQAEVILSSLSSKVKELQSIKTLMNGYETTLYAINVAEKDLVDCYNKGKLMQKEFIEVLKTNNICPTCHSTMGNESVEYLTGGFFQ